VRFENKNMFFYFENALAYCSAGVVFVNSWVVGFATGLIPQAVFLKISKMRDLTQCKHDLSQWMDKNGQLQNIQRMTVHLGRC
jgi:hypothetical protein